MIEVTYGIVEEQYYLEGNIRKSYGIVAYPSADNDNIAVVLITVNDITSDRLKLAELIKKCNFYKVSLIHIESVIEDFLTD